MTHQEIIDILKTIDGKDLHDENGMLTNIISELSQAGLYYVAYKDRRNIVVISSKIETLIFDLDMLFTYDILVSKENNELFFDLDMDNDLDPDRDDELYYSKKSHLNLIKIQEHEGEMEPTFEAVKFNILCDGERTSALLFTKEAIK